MLLRSVALAAVVMSAAAFSAAPASASAPSVLLVGSYHGIHGQFASIQAAVNAAKPGDWILVGPGDYHERGALDFPAGVLITTPDIHLRGMNRNTVIVDGTKRSAPRPCDGAYHSQWYGRKDHGVWAGMNGVVVYKASGVTLENFTACNWLLTRHGKGGNEIWFNGGDGSGKIGMHRYYGAYLTATSSYSHGINAPMANYGIFVSNADGPGLLDHTYSSNQGDAAYYIGACPDCGAVMNDAHGQFSALGYSGTNAGGHLIIQNSEFDHNKTGITTDSENNDDKPSPQDGVCPKSGTGPTGTASCEVWRNNFIHDNNNPNVPGVGNGLAGAAPVGTGIVIAGGRNDTLTGNRFVHNGSWGALIVDLPYMGTPPPGAHCQGGVPAGTDTCYFGAWSNELSKNSFVKNGFYGNPTNSDIAMATQAHNPGNCFSGNTDPAGLTSDPPNIQSPPYDSCSNPNGGDMGPLVGEALCATQLLFPCPSNPAANYPRPTKVKLHMAPAQPTMPDPCTGVPANPWCRGGGGAGGATVRANVTATATVEMVPRRRFALPLP
jgi:hypothetical protein